MYTFKLPDLGEGIHEGEILKWHVKENDRIEVDAPLVDVETDKAAVTIPSPVAGVISAISFKVGAVVNVGQVLVNIEEVSGKIGPTEKSTPVATAVPPRPETPSPALPLPTPSAPRIAPIPAVSSTASFISATKERAKINVPTPLVREKPAAPPLTEEKRIVPAAPATRRLARELGVDLAAIVATGPAGRVTLEDVKHYAQERSAQPVVPAIPPLSENVTKSPLSLVQEQYAEAEFAAHAASSIPFLDIEPLPDFSQWGPVEREALRSIRRRIAHKMVTSMILVPHVAHMDEADVTLLEEFRKKEKERRNGQKGANLTLLAFVIKAVTAGLKAAPAFNASLDPFSEEVIYKKYYHIGFAADTGKGLVVPVIKDTDRKSIIQISLDIQTLAQKAREGTLDLAEMKGGTFTITNIGPLGGTALIPAINYPEAAILGMGKVQEKPVVRDGQIVIRKMLPLTLAFDHRLADGADAARFVSAMVRQLSDPNSLLLET